jgi:ATP-dependent exoDNAse (exonuclease V) beta subunit
VVWWDPHALRAYLDAEAPAGVRKPELIVKDVAESVVESGLAAYREWQARLAATREQGRHETVRARTVREFVSISTQQSAISNGLGTKSRASGARRPAPDDVRVIEVARARSRPSGRRFGTLVHAVLATVPLDADRDRVQEIAVLQGRVLGSVDDEVAAAADIVHGVLAHDLLARARDASARGACRRETPVTRKMEDGTLVEGVVDLAFQDNGAWTVVDFKTDQELESEIDLYRRQVRLYADMVSAATGRPARAVLMRI